MSGEERPKRKWRRLVGIAFSVISLAALTYLAIALITGNRPDFSRMTGLFSSRAPVQTADEYDFDVGRERVVADLGGPLAAVGTLGLQVLDGNGNETLRDPFRAAFPAINAVNGRAVAFDIGGSIVRVFDDTQVITALNADGEVVSASINRNGWFCVSTQEGVGHRGVATVYNDKGNAVYKVNLASGYALSAVLSPDNKSLAVLNLTEGGSRITFYQGLNKQDPDSSFDLPGGLILDIKYLSNGSLVAISADALFEIDRSGASGILYEYYDKRINAYSFSDDFIVLHLLDYGVGYGGRLVMLDGEGTLLGELATDREIISMSLGGGCLAILRNDGLKLYDMELNELTLAGENDMAAGAGRILALSSGAALAVGEYSAIVVRADTEGRSAGQ